MTVEGKPPGRAHWRDSIFVDAYGKCWRSKIFRSGGVGVECIGQERDLLAKDENRVGAGRKGANARWSKRNPSEESERDEDRDGETISTGT